MEQSDWKIHAFFFKMITTQVISCTSNERNRTVERGKSYHEKNQYLSLDSIYIYIIDISIYLDLPQEEQTDTDVQIVD